jgi:hypothetical protein
MAAIPGVVSAGGVGGRDLPDCMGRLVRLYGKRSCDRRRMWRSAAGIPEIDMYGLEYLACAASEQALDKQLCHAE